MGGDAAPGEVVAGAVTAARDLGVSVCLVGPLDQMAAEVARVTGGPVPPFLTFLDAPDFITMDDAPLSALRRKPRASIKVAAEAVARGDAAAVYSAGHTGATLLAAHAAFGVLPGAERPALAVVVPTRTGAAVLLDTGATLECRPEHLRAFGLMGAAYARIALGVTEPRVGLLSVGEEAGKGTELVRDAHRLLSESALNFVGNLEARDFFTGQADVIVCDGFTGNVVLKVGEGLVELLEQFVGADVFAGFRARVDAAEHGAAPLLGLNGLALVGHGRSNAHAVCNGIKTAVRLAEGQMVTRLREALAK
jgi:glycerol-3-phosphate acyltransferase PlsX